ncbi:MAG TPA: ATP-binding protein [Azospirillum sp.]|nr:ATP-binding protein [Azospirillum sp.]
MKLLGRLFLLVGVALLPAIALQVQDEIGQRQSRWEAIRGATQRHAELLATEQTRIIDGARQFVMALSQAQSVKQLDSERCHMYFERLKAQFPQYALIDAMDVTGQGMCAGKPGTRNNVSDRAWFQLAIRNNGLAIGEYVVGKQSRKRSLHVSYPIHGEDGAIKGVIGAALDVDWLDAELAKRPMPEGMSLIIADRTGVVVARQPNGPEWIGRALPDQFRDMLNSTRPGTVEIPGLDGRPRVYSFKPLTAEPAGLLVAVGVDPAVAFANLDRDLRRTALLTAAGLVLALLCAWLVSRWFLLRPIRGLVAAMERWRVGDYTARAALGPGRDELSQLGRAFDAMADAVQTQATERERADEAMRVAKEEAEQANAAKSKFLAAASHDLRQPLQSMLLFSSVLSGLVEDERGRHSLRHLDESMKTLKDLLDSLLDASRLDAGKITPQVEEIEFAGLIEHLNASYTPMAERKGLRWSVDPGSGAVRVRSDRILLGRMLRNLIENAIRYTDQGRVWMDCRIVDACLRIEVHDTGIGIPTDQLGRIFEEFHQVRPADGTSSQGLGLGLSIVRKLARLLGHEVSVRSTVGRGTVFSIDVPVARADNAVPCAPAARGGDVRRTAAEHGRGRLALVIDDEEIVLLGLRSILEGWGYEVLGAASAEQALDLLREAGRLPDIVVSDYRLRGGRTGTAAILAVRDLSDACIPGVILTGDASPECRREAHEHGLGIALKPVTPSQLQRALDRHLKAAE